jgi:hypothetical protein
MKVPDSDPGYFDRNPHTMPDQIRILAKNAQRAGPDRAEPDDPDIDLLFHVVQDHSSASRRTTLDPSTSLSLFNRGSAVSNKAVFNT